jgi:hypothetical protein
LLPLRRSTTSEAKGMAPARGRTSPAHCRHSPLRHCRVTTPGGTFIDDNGNPHEANIEGIAAVRLTKGCNPPTNNMCCLAGSLTRAEMATLLI